VAHDCSELKKNILITIKTTSFVVNCESNPINIAEQLNIKRMKLR